MTKKYFGTDGIRGRVGVYPITPEFILKLGAAISWAIKDFKPVQLAPKVLIAKDTRVSGYLFEAALEAGLVSAGANIHLLGPMPTPAVAYLTRTFRADVGIVISASHNPFHDNGFKLFNHEGLKVSDEFELDIEHKVDQPLKMVGSDDIGKAVRMNDASGRYIEFCKSTFPNYISLHGLKIVLDCANGSTYHIAPHVFSELGAEVIEINNNPDGFNINQQCGSTHPTILRKIVLAEQADLGIALDGDGDRVIMVDHTGELVDGDQLLYIIATQMRSENKLMGGVVGTQMSNLGLERALADKNIDFCRSEVGDRYVMALLAEKKWLLGGENSGHIVCRNFTTTGDGIVSALQVLAAMIKRNQSLHELNLEWEKIPQKIINVPCDYPSIALKDIKIHKARTELEEYFSKNGRCFIRASGTEPLIRIMLEGEEAMAQNHYLQNFIALLNEHQGRSR